MTPNYEDARLNIAMVCMTTNIQEGIVGKGCFNNSRTRLYLFQDDTSMDTFIKIEGDFWICDGCSKDEKYILYVKYWS